VQHAGSGQLRGGEEAKCEKLVNKMGTSARFQHEKRKKSRESKKGIEKVSAVCEKGGV
jgi:hypothetical protein